MTGRYPPIKICAKSVYNFLAPKPLPVVSWHNASEIAGRILLTLSKTIACPPLADTKISRTVVGRLRNATSFGSIRLRAILAAVDLVEPSSPARYSTGCGRRSGHNESKMQDT